MPTTSVVRLAHEMRVEIEKDPKGQIRRRVNHLAHDVKRFAVSISPEPPGAWPQTPSTGAYKRAWRVERHADERGMPHYRVINDDETAIWVEYGTGPDRPGTRSTWGPDTPTPPQAVARRAAAAFQ